MMGLYGSMGIDGKVYSCMSLQGLVSHEEDGLGFVD